MRTVFSRTAFIVLALIMVFCASACSGGDEPSPTSAPTEAPSSAPTAAPTPAPTEAQASDEGIELDEAGYYAERLPGELKAARVSLPLVSGVQPETDYYSFYFEPVPEYDPALEDSFRVGGRLLYLELFNDLELMDFGTRAIASPADNLYVWQHLAGIEYADLPEDAYDHGDPITWLYAKFIDESGAVEYYGIGKDDLVYHVSLPNERRINSSRFTQVSVEPIDEIVHMHIAAMDIRYLHQERERVHYLASYSETGSFDIAHLICGGKTVTIDDPDKLERLEELLTATRTEKNETTGETVEYQCYLKEFSGVSVSGSLEDLPENSIRLVLLSGEGSDLDPENVKWSIYIAPDGSAYNVYWPFGVSNYYSFYYMFDTAVITKTPDRFDHAALYDFFVENAD